MECTVTSCLRPVFAKGLCHRHYDEQRKASMPPCSEDGCDQPQHASGLCNKHYREAKRASAPPCSVEGCERPVVARGLCDAHRKRQDKHGTLDPTRPADWGARESHPLWNSYHWIVRKRGQAAICDSWDADFWAFVQDMGERPSPRHRLARRDGEGPYSPENCYWREPALEPIDAKDQAEYQRKWAKAKRDKDPDYFKRYDLKRHFGITPEQFMEMYDAQGGKCAICGDKEGARNPLTQGSRHMAVDHCHSTGKIRGLLCTNCNLMLGNAKDSLATLEAAVAYLKS